LGGPAKTRRGEKNVRKRNFVKTIKENQGAEELGGGHAARAVGAGTWE